MFRRQVSVVSKPPSISGLPLSPPQPAAPASTPIVIPVVPPKPTSSRTAPTPPQPSARPVVTAKPRSPPSQTRAQLPAGDVPSPDACGKWECVSGETRLSTCEWQCGSKDVFSTHYIGHFHRYSFIFFFHIPQGKPGLPQCTPVSEPDPDDPEQDTSVSTNPIRAKADLDESSEAEVDPNTLITIAFLCAFCAVLLVGTALFLHKRRRKSERKALQRSDFDRNANTFTLEGTGTYKLDDGKGGARDFVNRDPFNRSMKQGPESERHRDSPLSVVGSQKSNSSHSLLPSMQFLELRNMPAQPAKIQPLGQSFPSPHDTQEKPVIPFVGHDAPARNGPNEIRFSTATIMELLENGFLPPNRLDAPDQVDVKIEYVAIYAYEPLMEDETKLSPGDIILIGETFDDGWASIYNVTRNAKGAAPLACISKINHPLLIRRKSQKNQKEEVKSRPVLQNIQRQSQASSVSVAGNSSLSIKTNTAAFNAAANPSLSSSLYPLASPLKKPTNFQSSSNPFKPPPIKTSGFHPGSYPHTPSRSSSTRWYRPSESEDDHADLTI